MINVSLIDYIGEIDGGVAVILSLLLNTEPYEIIYQFNQKNDFRITIEEKFYQHFPDVKDIYDYEYLIDLLYHIDNEVLPSREDIFKEFIA